MKVSGVRSRTQNHKMMATIASSVVLICVDGFSGGRHSNRLCERCQECPPTAPLPPENPSSFRTGQISCGD